MLSLLSTPAVSCLGPCTEWHLIFIVIEISSCHTRLSFQFGFSLSGCLLFPCLLVLLLLLLLLIYIKTYFSLKIQYMRICWRTRSDHRNHDSFMIELWNRRDFYSNQEKRKEWLLATSIFTYFFTPTERTTSRAQFCRNNTSREKSKYQTSISLLIGPFNHRDEIHDLTSIFIHS